MNKQHLLLPVPGLWLLYDPITGDLWRKAMGPEVDGRLRPVTARPARARRAWLAWVYTDPPEGEPRRREVRALGVIAALATKAVKPANAERLRVRQSAVAGGRPAIDNFEWICAGEDPIPLLRTIPEELRKDIERALRREGRRPPC